MQFFAIKNYVTFVVETFVCVKTYSVNNFKSLFTLKLETKLLLLYKRILNATIIITKLRIILFFSLQIVLRTRTNEKAHTIS